MREREVVRQGLLGRISIAIEPVLGLLVFGGLTAGLIAQHQYVIAPIFGLGALGFIAYAVCVLIAPIRALMETRRPIFIVDGYVRYRAPDDDSRADSNGYVAVLLEDRRVACEWPTIGEIPLPLSERPAMIEFSEYGGIHRIDGRSTGVLPDAIAPLGIGRV